MRKVTVYVVEESDKDVLELLKKYEPMPMSVEMDADGDVIGYFIDDDEVLKLIGIDGELYVPARLMPYKVVF